MLSCRSFSFLLNDTATTDIYTLSLHDALPICMSGLMSINGDADGPPLVVPIPIADIGTGMFGLVGILAALAHRERTGEGQAVDASLLETPIAWSVYEAAAFFATGEVPRRLGQGHRTNAPYQ